MPKNLKSDYDNERAIEMEEEQIEIREEIERIRDDDEYAEWNLCFDDHYVDDWYDFNFLL